MPRKIIPPDYHEVEQGEWLSKLAHWYGITKWETIWENPKNADLRAKRKSPDVLLAGDAVFIPVLEPKTVTRADGARHTFSLKPKPDRLRIVLKDADGKPLGRLDYELKVRRGQTERTYAGSTKDDGMVEQDILAGAESGELVVTTLGVSWPLGLGHLDPTHGLHDRVAIASGIQARLINLGYDCGDVDGIVGPKTLAAIKRYQEEVMQRANADGEPDPDTCRALLESHGC